jgi:toxin ParE1/3/4
MDLDEISFQISQLDARAGLRFLAAASRACDFLVEVPEAGGVWPTTNTRFEGIRVWPIRRFKKYLIFYRPVPGGIEVIRVLFGSQDLTEIFGM